MLVYSSLRVGHETPPIGKTGFLMAAFGAPALKFIPGIHVVSLGRGTRMWSLRKHAAGEMAVVISSSRGPMRQALLAT